MKREDKNTPGIRIHNFIHTHIDIHIYIGNHIYMYKFRYVCGCLYLAFKSYTLEVGQMYD